MNYKIILDSNEEVVFISGSFEEPFSANSLFELTVRCDSITVVDDPYYSNQIGLLFHRGNPSGYKELRMQIFKRPDGDLKVWPAPI